MKNEMMIFENHEVEIFEFNGKVLFNPRHVGECLDIDEVTVRRHIQEMNEKQVVKLTNESIVHTMNFRKLHNTGENFLTESGVYKLIFKSRKPEAEKFQDWVTDVVLPAIRKTGGYQIRTYRTERDEFDMGMMALDAAARLLNMSEISKLACLKNLCGEFNVSIAGLPKSLPRPVQILSATELLKRAGKPMSIHQFNQKMLDAGFLEIQTRPSTNGKETRTFKALTAKGLQYGENSVNPDYPMETHPHYFVDSFAELVIFLENAIDADILSE